MKMVASGEITIMDITDARQLISYIGASRPKTVIYDPSTDMYKPNYSNSEDNQILSPQIFVAGSSTDLSDKAKSVRWFYKKDSSGDRVEIKEDSDTYEISKEGVKSLKIKDNVVKNVTTMLYICEVIYYDEESDLEIPMISEIEILKVSNGQKGESGKTPIKGVDYFDGKDGQDGSSSYLWVMYSDHEDGTDMRDDPLNAVFIGLSTTESPTKPKNKEDYIWSKVKGEDGIQGEDGEDGRASYLHIKYSNDEGKTFTDNNGEAIGDWIGMYVDFEEKDSNDVKDYVWNKVKGEDGDSPIVGTIWTPNGNTIKNNEGTLTAVMNLYKDVNDITPDKYKWYIQDPSATESSGGDADGGNGWRLLTSSYNAGITGYNTSTITIPADAIASVESFKCVALIGNMKVQDYCTVIDSTDPIAVMIIGMSTFKNGQGSSEFEAKLYRNGEEIDTDGKKYLYSWSLYDKDNIKIPNFSKAGKKVSVDSSSFLSRANLICEVSEK